MLLPLIAILLTCLFATTLGALCGIGGGVIIKPMLDAIGVVSVKQASFLSCCTVLCMSTYTVITSSLRDKTPLENRTIWPMGIGAVAGGLLGKAIFQRLGNGELTVKLIQSAVLFLLLLFVLVYQLKKEHIRTKHIESIPLCVLIGFLLGLFSAFLGVGGGPFNMAVLSYFFSMDTKKGARHSLCIILCSQAASLVCSLPTFDSLALPVSYLAAAILAGILGGVLGRRLNRRFSERVLGRLFLACLVFILLLCLYNAAKSVFA